MQTPPPEYQKCQCVETLAIVPTEGKFMGHVGMTGADFDTREITARLERLEPTTDEIKAAILAGNATTTSKQTSGFRRRCCSLRRSCWRSWSTSVKRQLSRTAQRRTVYCFV